MFGKQKSSMMGLIGFIVIFLGEILFGLSILSQNFVYTGTKPRVVSSGTIGGCITYKDNHIASCSSVRQLFYKDEKNSCNHLFMDNFTFPLIQISKINFYQQLYEHVIKF